MERDREMYMYIYIYTSMFATAERASQILKKLIVADNFCQGESLKSSKQTLDLMSV